MKKFQVSIRFEMDEAFMHDVPRHRTIVNKLIEDGIIDHYVVSMETMRSWITFTVASREDVENHLRRSPLYKYWEYDIHEIFVVDGQHYRLPALQYN